MLYSGPQSQPRLIEFAMPYISKNLALIGSATDSSKVVVFGNVSLVDCPNRAALPKTPFSRTTRFVCSLRCWSEPQGGGPLRKCRILGAELLGEQRVAILILNAGPT